MGFVEKKRPIINPNAGFITQLQEYEKKLSSSLSTQIPTKITKFKTQPRPEKKSSQGEKFEYNEEEIFRNLCP